MSRKRTQVFFSFSTAEYQLISPQQPSDPSLGALIVMYQYLMHVHTHARTHAHTHTVTQIISSSNKPSVVMDKMFVNEWIVPIASTSSPQVAE